ncbi:MAG: mechanosensitive ion channel [Phycisphaerae bacterium]|nr:mechanosensitive ion channel [Phycisphaerae bacterium]
MPKFLENLPYETIINAVVIFAVFYIASMIINYLLKRASKRYDTSASEVFRLLSNSQRALLLIIGAIIAISKLGFDMSAIVAGLGLTGFALGFALKDTISNLIAGMMIVLYKPFEIGSEVDISGSCGTVIDINLRYITLKTEDGTCLVPNSFFLSKKLTLKKDE